MTRFQPWKLHFFKPILPGHNKQLSIPVSFMGYLKEEKCEGEAILTSYNLGRSWTVKIEGRVFQDGWKEFVQDHNLQVGDFLVFRHQGGMNFHVMVFDSTACERDYPKPLGDHEVENLHCGEAEEEEEAPYFTTQMKRCNFTNSVMHIPHEFARSNGFINRPCEITLIDKSGRSWQVNLRQQKCNGHVYIAGGWSAFSAENKLKMGDMCTFKLISAKKKIVMEITVSRSKESQHPAVSTVRMREDSLLQDGGKTKKSRKEIGDVKIKSMDVAGSTGTPLVTNAVEEDEAPSFTATIKHYNLTNSIMTIPLDFARAYGLVNRRCIVTLIRNEIGEHWNAYLRFTNNSGYVYIGQGWHEFLVANKLRVGDLCTFVLISRKSKVVFEVNISRCNGGSSSNTAIVPMSVEEEEKVVPSFTATMKDHNFKDCIMTIPMNFARCNDLMERDCMITLKDGKGKSWQVNMKYKKSSGQVYIREGWRAFSKANKLRKGDVCTFKLVSKGKEVVFKVDISRFSS